MDTTKKLKKDKELRQLLQLQKKSSKENFNILNLPKDKKTPNQTFKPLLIELKKEKVKKEIVMKRKWALTCLNEEQWN